MKSLAFVALAGLAASGWALPSSDALDKPIRGEWLFEPITDVVRQIRQETKVNLAVDAVLAGARFSASVDGGTRRELLEGLAGVHDAEWKRDGNTWRLVPTVVGAERIASRSAAERKQSASLFQWLNSGILLSPQASEEIRAKASRLRAEAESLRQTRPEGWSERYAALLDEINGPLGAMADQPVLHAVMRLMRAQPPRVATWQSGKRLRFWLSPSNTDPVLLSLITAGRTASLKGVVVETYIVQGGASLRMDWAEVRTDAPAAISTMTLPIASAPDHQVDSTPWAPQKVAPRRERIPLSWGFAKGPVRPGDIDALRVLHRTYGFNVIHDGIRSTELMDALQRTDAQTVWTALSERTNLRATQNWLLLRSDEETRLRTRALDENMLKRLERNGASDVNALGASVPGLLQFGTAELTPIRLGTTIEPGSVFPTLVWDFWAALSPQNLQRISTGQAVPYAQMPTEAQALFRLAVDLQSPTVRGTEWLMTTDRVYDDMFFYFERVGRLFFRATDPTGRTISGGINDGAQTTLNGVPFLRRQELTQYELNFYFGRGFQESVQHQTILLSDVPPPAPKEDPNAAPPQGHEGHGPGDGCPLCAPR